MNSFHWIAHRGNVSAPNLDRENHPNYVVEAIEQGFDVEIDVWLIDDCWWLGHDAPEHSIAIGFFEKYHMHLWLHAKNKPAYDKLISEHANFNTFSHTTEPSVMTSLGIEWVYPGYPLGENSICVLPEIVPNSYNVSDLKKCKGICSDYIGKLFDQSFGKEKRTH